MPSIEHLVPILSGAGLKDSGQRAAYMVAGQLVASALKGQSNDHLELDRSKIIQESGGRLWGDYTLKRMDGSVTPREAARDAILNEQYTLEGIFKKIN